MGRTAGVRTMPLPLPITEYRDLPVTVMGLGRFGGGLGAVKFLIDRGARVTVTDLRPQPQLAEALREFDASQLVRLQCGGHVEADFAEAQLVVVNPAVKPDCPWLRYLRERNIPRTSEMNLFWHHNRGRVIGVTGSNGKSTTTALIAHLLRNAGRTVHLGGNIGGSLLPIVDTIQPTDWVVLELSSFQLADLDRIESSPEIAVVTNFAPNHLDWHPDLNDYRRAKQTILRWQTPSSTAVLNEDDPDVRHWPTLGRIWMFGHEANRTRATRSRIVVVGTDLHINDESAPTSTETISLSGQFPLPGEHNAMNVAAAIGAVREAGVNTEQITPALRTFQGLPHRLEHVATVDGRTFFNDSLATTPESAICALRAFSGRVLLLAGGYDKHVDLTYFALEAARRCSAIAWMGQTATQLQLVAAGVTDSAPSQRIVFSLREAFDWLWNLSQPGDTILLSPACASFDWFLNFADRGERFRECVHEKSRAITNSQSGTSRPSSLG